MNYTRGVLRNTVVLAISDFANRIGGMILAFFIARALHASGLGVYVTCTTYYALLVVAGGMGAESFLIREIAKDRTSTSRYLIHASILGIAASAVVIIIFFLVLPFLGYSSQMKTGMYIIMLATIPGTLSTVQNAVFVAHQRMEFVMVTRLIAVVFEVGASMVLLALGYGVEHLLIVFVAVEYLVMFCFYYFTSHYIATLHWEFDRSFVVKLLKEIRTFAALSLMAAFLAQPEIVLLSLTQSETESGFFVAALKLVMLWQFISQLLMTNVYPVLSHSYHTGDQRFKAIQDKSIKYLFALSLPLSAGLIAAAKPIIWFLYGPGFGEAVLPLRLLAGSIPMFYLSAVLWRVLAARDQQGLVLRSRIITLFIRVGGGYLAIHWFAANGAAWTATISLILQTVLLIIYASRGKNRLDIFQLGWRFTLASLGMGVITWLCSTYVDLWVLVILAVAIYLSLVVLLKAFSSDDLDIFRQILPRQTSLNGKSQ